MFSKVALFITAALAASAMADQIKTIKCNSGPVQCCESLEAPTSSDASKALGLLKIDVKTVTGKVGLQCTPIVGIGASTRTACVGNPLCCEKIFSELLVGINCTAVTIGAI